METNLYTRESSHWHGSGSETTMDILAKNVALVSPFQDKLESSEHLDDTTRAASVLSTANVAVHWVEFHLCVKLQSVMHIRKCRQSLQWHSGE